jgi:hypothetical protein
MGFAFEGFAIAEFAGGAYSCAEGLAPDIVGYLPAFLPNTTAIAAPFVRDALLHPGEGCVIDLGGWAVDCVCVWGGG